MFGFVDTLSFLCELLQKICYLAAAVAGIARRVIGRLMWWAKTVEAQQALHQYSTQAFLGWGVPVSPCAFPPHKHAC